MLDAGRRMGRRVVEDTRGMNVDTTGTAATTPVNLLRGVLGSLARYWSTACAMNGLLPYSMTEIIFIHCPATTGYSRVHTVPVWCMQYLPGTVQSLGKWSTVDFRLGGRRKMERERTKSPVNWDPSPQGYHDQDTATGLKS